MKMYLVGGAVRDEIMGVRSKDLDYSVVLDEQDRWIQDSAFYSDPFQVMVLHLMRMGYNIFLETPEHLTVRAQTPDRKETADFVLARKEGTYSDGRRPDSVEVGTLTDDLARRDFTMNAIAKDSDGSYIDPFNGQADIHARIIRAVGDPFERLLEDALRAVRALRFSVTKGLTIDSFLAFAMKDDEVLAAIENNISDERIDIELSKMFRFDTLKSLTALHAFPALTDAIFSGRVSLDSTMKTKGRGK
jgi:tRNA nucleotidyltransferase (CCA-adding enzyme)